MQECNGGAGNRFFHGSIVNEALYCAILCYAILNEKYADKNKMAELFHGWLLSCKSISPGSKRGLINFGLRLINVNEKGFDDQDILVTLPSHSMVPCFSRCLWPIAPLLKKRLR